MKKNRKWLLLVLAAVLVIALAAWKWLALRPQQPSPERRGKILDELVAAGPWLGGLAPDHSGETLAYIVETEAGRRVTLLDLKNLAKRQIATTNDVKTICGWSADDRYLAFLQMYPRPMALRQATEQAMEMWLTIYDRQNDSFRRLTEETNVVDVKFFWVGTDSFLITSRRMRNKAAQFSGWMLGDLRQPYRQNVAEFKSELSVMTENMAVFGTDDLFTLELPPAGKTGTGLGGTSGKVRKLSDFKTNGFTGLLWVNYSPQSSNFLFCSRPSASNRRYLYQYNPATREVAQVSHEDTYNGQWVLGGKGVVYVINTNDSFHLAIRGTGPGDTDLFAEGSLEVYRASPSGEKVYAAAAAGYEPQGIWEYTITNRALRKVAEGSSRPLEFSQVVPPRAVLLKSFDGVQTPCFFFPPVGTRSTASPNSQPVRDAVEHVPTVPERYMARELMSVLRPRAKHPAVIYVPPGSSQFQRRFDRQAQVFANLGFHYAVINYRGCDGYGPEYKNLGNTRDAALDVVNLYEKLVADPGVDGKNIFLTTASGGTAVVIELLATRPDLWAGVVLDRPGELGIDRRLDPAKLPPILMVMGGLDRGFASMNAFVAWATTNHVDIKSLVYTNSEHGTYSLAERKETLQQSSEFFLSHLR